MLVDGTSDRRQHVFFGYSQFAADDDKFRIENVYQSCYCPSERMSDLFDAFNGKYIFFVQCGQNVVQGYFPAAFILFRKYGCLSCFQFFVVGVLSSLLALVFEAPLLSAIWDCKIHLFFAGVVTCGVAYTLQIFGQKNTPPIVASLIMSLESVFAVLGGMLLLNETLSLRELSGCLLMIAAVILSKLKPQALYPGDSNTKD